MIQMMFFYGLHRSDNIKNVVLKIIGGQIKMHYQIGHMYFKWI